MSESGYLYGEGGIADYDQSKAEAIALLRGSDSFLLIVGNPDQETFSGMRLTHACATVTPFAPYFLAQCVQVLAAVQLQSIEAIVSEDDEHGPGEAEA